MEPQQAIILGVIQGLTEFLPVSSSGHLVIFQNFFGLTEPEVLFDIFLHLGTLTAVCIVFITEIRSIILAIWCFPRLLRASKSISQLLDKNQEIKMAVLIVIGSIPTAGVGLILERASGQIFGSVGLVGGMLLVTGLLLWFTRRLQDRRRCGRMHP